MSDDHSGGLTIAERLRRIEHEVGTVNASVQELLSRDRADLVRIEALEARTSKVEDWQRWAMRAVVGAVIVSGLAALLG